MVIGVFFGLQVQNWNELRQESWLENQYLERMHIDVLESIAETSTTFQFQTLVRTDLDRAIQAFRSDSEVLELATDQCLAIYFSHIYDDIFLPQAAVTELIASGQFSILKDERLRTRLIAHARSLGGWQEAVDGIQVDRVVLSSRYPALIDLGLVLAKFTDVQTAYLADDLDGLAECDLMAMRQTPGFKNDLIDNSSRHTAYFAYLSEQQDHLRLIHEALDDVMSIKHN